MRVAGHFGDDPMRKEAAGRSVEPRRGGDVWFRRLDLSRRLDLTMGLMTPPRAVAGRHD